MSNKKLYRIVILIIAALAILSMVTGCQSKAPQDPKPPTYTPTPVEPDTDSEIPPAETPATDPEIESLVDFIPLKVGHKWEYEGEGNEFASFTQEVLYEKDNRYQLSTNTGGTVMANILEVNKDSIVNVYRSGEQYEGKNLLDRADNLDITLLKLPVEVGTKWISEENVYEIMQTNAAVSVPYGDFENCIVVKLTFKDGSESRLYYKDGIGLLQSEFTTGSETIYSRLKGFSQGK